MAYPANSNIRLDINSSSNNELPAIIVTGGSGFIGRHFINLFKDEFRCFAIARRSRAEVGIPYHPNIHWIQTDLGNKASVAKVTDYLKEQGKIDFCLHLAAFYDFTGKDNREYVRTNVEGTNYVLEMLKAINIERFIFVSSVAASRFDREGTILSEKSELDAAFPYARSKYFGEEATRKYSEYFPCSIVRLAAVFSDWCEYPPLYKFLGTWLSGKYDSRILAGKGESAVPYIHIQDVLNLFHKLIKKSSKLPDYDIYIASPDGSTSHKELYNTSTHYSIGHTPRPIHIPKISTYLGIPLKRFANLITFNKNQTFERLWMVPYIDKKLNIDSAYTRKALDWDITPRFKILRRLPLILEKMKSHSMEWCLRNEEILKVFAQRANLMIYERLIVNEQKLLLQITEEIMDETKDNNFKIYHKMDDEDFKCYLSAIYHLLMAAVRSGDRSLMLEHIKDVALRRFAEGYRCEDIKNVLMLFQNKVISLLTKDLSLKRFKQEIYDYIGMTLQLAQDQVDDLYHELLDPKTAGALPDKNLIPDCDKLQELVRQLSAFYQVFPDEQISKK